MEDCTTPHNDDSMKSVTPSSFNMYIPYEDKFILYNTLEDTILLADRELKEALEKGCIPEEFVQPLKKTGMITDMPREDLIYTYMYNSAKFETSTTYFTFLPTYACNLQCPYCYEKAGTVLSHSMDKTMSENVSQFMKKMVEENRSRDILLKLYGGEPLLNTDAIYPVYDALSDYSHTSKTGFYIVLQTNGTLITKEIINTISNHLWTVEMTLEGDKSHHDTMRVYKKGGGTYEDIMKAIEILLDSNIHVALRINVSDPGNLDVLLKDMKERGIPGERILSLYITQTSDFGLEQFFTDDLLCLHDEKKSMALIPELREVVDKNGFRKNLVTFDTLQRKKILPCNSERKGMYVIDPHGDVYLCFFTAGQKEFSMGSIKEKGEISWNPSYYEIMSRNPSDFAECRSCPLLPMCGGGCHIRAYKQKGSYSNPHCGNTKEVAEERIKLYLRQKYPQKFGGIP